MSAIPRLEELDKDSMVPLYRQMARSVEKKIQDGPFPKGSPVLELQRLTYSTEKRPVEYAVLFFPGESYELRTLISDGGKSALKVERY
jgi:DNA-binding GntR family transcriptional regulator